VDQTRKFHPFPSYAPARVVGRAVKIFELVARHLGKPLEKGRQFSEGFSARSITKISTDPFCDSSLRPSCS
jgi:hypothetical protein